MNNNIQSDFRRTKNRNQRTEIALMLVTRNIRVVDDDDGDDDDDDDDGGGGDGCVEHAESLPWQRDGS